MGLADLIRQFKRLSKSVVPLAEVFGANNFNQVTDSTHAQR
jgi:hypothetical protein